MSDCLFCRIIAGEIPAYRVYENDAVVAFLDIHPSSLGHTLVVPREHAQTIGQNSPEAAHAVIDVARSLAPKIQESVGATAYNLTFNSGAAAGQQIFHTHAHIIPRFDDDRGKGQTDAGSLAALAKKISERIQAV